MFCRKCGKDIDDKSTFCRFCGTEVTPVVQETRIQREYRQNNELFNRAKELMDSGSFDEARTIFLDLSGFRNADELAERCITGAIDHRRRTTYEYAAGVLNNDKSTESELLQAAEDLKALGEYEDTEELANKCRSKADEIVERTYRSACELMSGARTSAEMLSACEEFEKIGRYKDSFELAQKGRSQLDRYKNYEYAVKCFNEAYSVQQLLDVIKTLRATGDFLDSEEMLGKALEKIYKVAVEIELSHSNAEKLYDAANTFEAIKSYKDSKQRAQECRKRAEKIITDTQNKASLEEKEANEREFQYCQRILNNPKAPISELERIEGRLRLIKDHEGATAAIMECRKRQQALREKSKQNIVTGIVIASVIVVVILGIIILRLIT